MALRLTGEERQAYGRVEEKLDCNRIFGRRVRACPAADWAVFYVVESSFLRSFQR